MVQLNGTTDYGTTYWCYELWYKCLVQRAVVLRAMVQRNGTTNYGRMIVNDEGLKTKIIQMNKD